MATYITLWKLTDQGIKNIKDSPRRVETTVKAVEEAGGKMKGVYVTMGEYDFVTIADAANDESYMAVMMQIGSMGNVRTTTLKAFTQEEFIEILKKLS